MRLLLSSLWVILLGAWNILFDGWTVLRVLRVPPIPWLQCCGVDVIRLVLQSLVVRDWVVATVRLDRAAELACTQATQLWLHRFRVICTACRVP